jgi:16S rRNA G966 N2-methylase RsmD
MKLAKKKLRPTRLRPKASKQRPHKSFLREAPPPYRVHTEDFFIDVVKTNGEKHGYNPSYEEKPFTDFASIDRETDLTTLNLNWREKDLPEVERTKHVHRLHPYLGKYIPQLVEIFLRKFQPETVYDPFAGSGTTFVEAQSLGIASVGCDVSAFNCLLAKVKTDFYNLAALEREVRDILLRLNERLSKSLFCDAPFQAETDSAFLKKWFHPKALNQLLCFRDLISDYQYQDVFKIILSRSARSARMTTHFDLDFPKHPQTEPYYCYKHSRTCSPTQDALGFLNRYALDTVDRIKEFSSLAKRAKVTILNQDARFAKLPEFDLVITSPPYVGLIDYHEQHRYAYELLGLPFQSEQEIGAAFKGSSQAAKRKYGEEIGQVIANIRLHLSPRGRVVIVVNDKHSIYSEIMKLNGFCIEQRLKRHVNRRTGRRAGDFFEEILICRRYD